MYKRQLHEFSVAQVDRAPAQCSEGHRFESRRGLRFFLCPTLMTCWLFHFHNIFLVVQIFLMANFLCLTWQTSLVIVVMFNNWNMKITDIPLHMSPSFCFPCCQLAKKTLKIHNVVCKHYAPLQKWWDMTCIKTLKGLCQLESMHSEVMQITFNCQNSIVFNAWLSPCALWGYPNYFQLSKFYCFELTLDFLYVLCHVQGSEFKEINNRNGFG